MNQPSIMCSLTQILNYGWLFLIILLLEKSSAADYWYEACAPRICGKVNISFPFYVQGVQEHFCGQPEFGINCSDSSSPIIHVPENDYVIDDIFYQDQTLRVHNSAVSSITNCLPQIQNLTENRTLYVAEKSSLLLLSNCNKTLPGVLQKYRKDLCHPEDQEEWGLAMLGDDQNLNIAFEMCTRNVLVPVEGEENVGENGVVDYNGLLRRGFVFKWIELNCSECELSGGRCGFNTTSVQFLCFCPDRPHRVSCKPPAPVDLDGEKYYPSVENMDSFNSWKRKLRKLPLTWTGNSCRNCKQSGQHCGFYAMRNICPVKPQSSLNLSLSSSLASFLAVQSVFIMVIINKLIQIQYIHMFRP